MCWQCRRRCRLLYIFAHRCIAKKCQIQRTKNRRNKNIYNKTALQKTPETFKTYGKWNRDLSTVNLTSNVCVHFVLHTAKKKQAPFHFWIIKIDDEYPSERIIFLLELGGCASEVNDAVDVVFIIRVVNVQLSSRT